MLLMDTKGVLAISSKTRTTLTGEIIQILVGEKGQMPIILKDLLQGFHSSKHTICTPQKESLEDVVATSMQSQSTINQIMMQSIL